MHLCSLIRFHDIVRALSTFYNEACQIGIDKLHETIAEYASGSEK